MSMIGYFLSKFFSMNNFNMIILPVANITDLGIPTYLLQLYFPCNVSPDISARSKCSSVFLAIMVIAGVMDIEPPHFSVTNLLDKHWLIIVTRQKFIVVF